jgi:NAD(P)H-dependent flavin oxidoreductase YrpB (nitropropane dioxygenase family)
MGADFAYIGSTFLAIEEARATDAYKQAIADDGSDDIVYSYLFTGVHGNYLAPSIRAARLDPENLPESDPSKMNFSGTSAKAWRKIWGCGQGIAVVKKAKVLQNLWSSCGANTRRLGRTWPCKAKTRPLTDFRVRPGRSATGSVCFRDPLPLL